MAQELAADGVGDERALVADDGVVEPGLGEVRAHGLEHAAGDDDHVHAERAHLAIAARVRGRSTASCAISVRSRSHANAATSCGKSAGKLYGPVVPGLPPVDLTTYDATSAICWSESWPLNDGIWPFPSVTRAVASR